MPVVHAPQSHLKRNHFTSKQSATTSRHNSHLLSNDLASTVYTLSQAFPPPFLTSLQHVSVTSVGIYHHTPTYYHQRCLAHVECPPTIHMCSEGGSCSLCIDGIEQAANYKTHSGSLAVPRRCYCAASCRVGKMSLSAQSQVAVSSANEVRPRNPHGELHEGRWCWRLRKYTQTRIRTLGWWLWFVSCQPKWVNMWQTRGTFRSSCQPEQCDRPAGLCHSGAQFRQPKYPQKMKSH